MNNNLTLMSLVFCICLTSCIKTENSNQSQIQNQQEEEKKEEEHEIKDVDKINRILNSYVKIYSFKGAELIKSDEAFSPPKDEKYKYKNINLRINSENIKMYDSNMLLIKSFRIKEKSISYKETWENSKYTILLKYEHSTDKLDEIIIFSEKDYQESPKINAATIEYHFKGLKYSWYLDNIFNSLN